VIVSDERDRAQPRQIANQAVDGGLARAGECLGAHGVAEAGELLFGLARQRRTRGIVQAGPRRIEQLAIERSQPRDERLPLRSSRAAGRIQFASHANEKILEPRVESAGCARRRQSPEHSLQMGRQRRAAMAGGDRASGGRSSRCAQPRRATPLVERIEHVSLAEVDAHRPPPRTFGVVPLEISIDPAERHFERHALRRPRRDEVE